MPTRRAYLRAVAGGCAVGVTGSIAGCAGGPGTTDGSGSDGVQTVKMVELSFAPETITIPAGTTVRWVNESQVEHTVTAYEDGIPAAADYFASGGFASESAARTNLSKGLVATGGRYEHTFSVAGEYRYYCIPHEGSGMKGVVRVKK